MVHHKQVFDELDRIFAKQLKRINQYIKEHQQRQVNVNHEYPIQKKLFNEKNSSSFYLFC